MKAAAILLAIAALAGPRSAAACPKTVSLADCCAAAKIDAVSKAAVAQETCYSVVNKTPGNVVDPNCVAKARTKLAAAFRKAELKGGCATVGDADGINTEIIDVFGVETGREYPPTLNGPPCNCGPSPPDRVGFVLQPSVGECGTVHDTSNAIRNLDCGIVYTGGGTRDIHFPAVNALPQYADVLSCATSRLQVGPTNVAGAGIRNCTSTGCTYGAPLDLSPPNICVVSTFRADLTGTIDCHTGEVNIATPVQSDVYSGVCPKCVSGSCDSGANNGGACTADTPAGTSVDCPPTPPAAGTAYDFDFIGTTGTSAKAPLATTAQSQTNTICGFCRQPGNPAFEIPAHRCVYDSDCTTGVFTVCQQYTGGAFGNPLADQITMTGAPLGDLTDGLGHVGTLVNVFCIGPSANTGINTTGDIPSPGALGGQTQATLLQPHCAFDLEFGSFGPALGQFDSPTGIALDTSNNVYVADPGKDEIEKFDASGNFLTEFGSAGSAIGQLLLGNPAYVAADSTGHVYVTDAGNNRVQAFDMFGSVSYVWGSPGPGDGQFGVPTGIAVDGSGNVFVADKQYDRIQKFDSVGNFITKWGTNGSGDGMFVEPAGVAVDASGNVYVADHNDRVQKFDGNGNFITKWGVLGSHEGEFNDPLGVTVDGSGRVYVADSVNNRIQVFDGTGTFLWKWGLYGPGDGEFVGPVGVGADSSTGVYVSDGGNVRIAKYTCP